MQVRAIVLKDRGPTPRGFASAMTAAKRLAWRATAEFFHSELRDNRFTRKHGRVAQYKARSRKYTAKKKAIFRHDNPLEFTGELRRLVRMVRIQATPKIGRAKYPGGRRMNLRHRNSRIRMRLEFQKITAREERKLAKVNDKTIDRQLKIAKATKRKTIR